MLRFVLRSVYRRWRRDRIFFSASSLAFNILVTAIPLCLLIVSVGSLALKSSAELRTGLESWLDEANPFLPGTARQDLESLLLKGSAASGLTGLAGVLLLMLLVSRLFGNIRTAFHSIFETDRPRNAIRGKLFDLLLSILATICFVLAFVFATLANLVADSPVGRLVSGWPILGDVLGRGSAGLLAVSFTVLLLFLLYWAVPNRRVTVRQALFATALAWMLGALGTELYTWLISRPHWGFVYGSLAGVMATFLWVYWLCVIFLASAEASQVGREWLQRKRPAA
jgi:YihY family inner membrane protein